MVKKNNLINQRKKNNKKNKITSKKIIIIGISFTIIGLIIYGGITSLKSFNGNFLLSPPRNFFMKATYVPNEGNVYTSQSTGTAKLLNSGAGNRGGLSTGHNPTIMLNQGHSLSIHLINEDSETHSKHNLNIDEFGVHTQDLGYFQTQTVTFTANKTGTFNYYCSIHPEMKGKIIITGDHTK
ncbi:MAG: cupredoxin domain-containing protein [Nitrososphaeraceae archaeon]